MPTFLWLTSIQLTSVEVGSIRADFTGADLRDARILSAQLMGGKFHNADLTGAQFMGTNLNGASFIGANLQKAQFMGALIRDAEFYGANLTGANLRGADLSRANLYRANLCETDLRGAILINANLVGANISNAKISNSKVHSVNVWDLEGEFSEQEDLIITPKDKSEITVDNIEIAQFIYLILNNKKIRNVLNTLTSKTVLILGRFSVPERKAILDALKNKLREYDLLPIVFDFDRPTDKDFTETIKTLAGISYFVIADVTNPKSSPLELQATVPDYQIPFVPIIQEGEEPFAMMVDFKRNIIGYCRRKVITPSKR